EILDRDGAFRDDDACMTAGDVRRPDQVATYDGLAGVQRNVEGTDDEVRGDRFVTLQRRDGISEAVLRDDDLVPVVADRGPELRDERVQVPLFDEHAGP